MRTDLPALSFVLPVYNVERYLPKCLDSLLAQSRQDIEIVVVDDGSTDQSLAVCRAYARRDPRISWITQHNQGQGVARNRGVDVARGRYICFVDPDDWLETTMAEALVPAMDLSGADFGNFRIDFVTEAGRVTHTLPPFAQAELTGVAILNCAMVDAQVHSSPCNKIYSRAFLLANDLRFPAVRAYEDIYYSRVLASAARKCIFANEVYYHALIRPGSTTRRMDSSRILLAIEVIELERRALASTGASSRTRGLFDAHVVKFLSYLLVLAAYRIADRADYAHCIRFAQTIGFRELVRTPPVLAHLNRKNRWIARLTVHPRLTRVLAQGLKVMGIQPY